MNHFPNNTTPETIYLLLDHQDDCLAKIDQYQFDDNPSRSVKNYANFLRGIFFLKENLYEYFQYLPEMQKQKIQNRIEQQTLKIERYHNFLTGYFSRLIR